MRNNKADIDQAFRISAAIWFIMVLAQLTFLVLVISAKPQLLMISGADILGKDTFFVLGFVFLAMINFVISMFVKKWAIGRAIAEKEVRYVQTGLVIGSAFCESISLMGCVMALVFDYPYFYAWFVFGLAGILMHFPRKADLIAAS
jgi:hypothetical protein